MERRLAAILVADVVGYSRLMELDEGGTLAALKAHRTEFIDPAVAKHGGRTVKLMGDGALGRRRGGFRRRGASLIHPGMPGSTGQMRKGAASEAQKCWRP